MALQCLRWAIPRHVSGQLVHRMPWHELLLCLITPLDSVAPICGLRDTDCLSLTILISWLDLEQVMAAVFGPKVGPGRSGSRSEAQIHCEFAMAAFSSGKLPSNVSSICHTHAGIK